LTQHTLHRTGGVLPAIAGPGGIAIATEQILYPRGLRKIHETQRFSSGHPPGRWRRKKYPQNSLHEASSWPPPPRVFRVRRLSRKPSGRLKSSSSPRRPLADNCSLKAESRLPRPPVAA
jgi:hypothetical protein